MAKLLQFPAMGSNPKPPGPTGCMPRPVEPIMTDARSNIHVLPAPVSGSRPTLITSWSPRKIA